MNSRRNRLGAARYLMVEQAMREKDEGKAVESMLEDHEVLVVAETRRR